MDMRLGRFSMLWTLLRDDAADRSLRQPLLRFEKRRGVLSGLSASTSSATPVIAPLPAQHHRAEAKWLASGVRSRRALVCIACRAHGFVWRSWLGGRDAPLLSSRAVQSLRGAFTGGGAACRVPLSFFGCDANHPPGDAALRLPASRRMTTSR